MIALDDSDEDLLPTSKSPPRKASSSTKPTTRKPPRLYGAFLSDSESETEAPAPITHTNRSPSLEMLDPALPEDQDEMFPELVAEARAKEAAAKAQALSDLQAKLRRPSAITSDSNTGSNSPGFSRPLGVDAAAAPSSPAVPQVVQDPVIQILVTSQLPGTVPLVVKRKLTQRFKDVRMAWCDVQSVSDVSPSRRMTESEKSSIFLTWRGRRIWDSGNGLSIGVRVGRNGTVVDENGEVLGEGDEGKVNLEAWTQEWYDKVKSEAKRATNVAAAQAGDRIELSDDEDVEAQAQAEAEREKEKAAIRIVLKAKDAEVVKLKVRPITSVSKLVGAWRSQRDVEEGKDVELWFEGERLEEEGTVEEADIEDMCVVDVIVR